MSTKQSTMDYILDQVSSVKNVRARKMFGEYAMYCDEKIVALICDDTLFVKITEPGKKLLAKNYKEGSPYPGAKPCMKIDEGLIEDRELLSKLIRLTADTLPAPLPKKNKPKPKS